ncbi:MAG: hypothetical protein AAGF19_05770, partial [Pseudomonadota bacterium]
MISNRKRLPRLCFLLLALILVAACASTPPPPPTAPPLRFTGEPIEVFVRDVTFVEAYSPPLAPPHIEHEFGIFPAQIVRNWASDRLKLVGGQGELTITILDGRVVETVLPVNQSVGDFVRVEPANEWQSVLDVEVTYRGPLGTSSGRVTANALRTLNEGTTLNQRTDAYYSLLQDLAG